MTDTSDPRVCPTPDLDNGREPKHPKHPKRDPRCPPCDPPPLCELACLVRPEFHCGQELTEDDLTALVRRPDRRPARATQTACQGKRGPVPVTPGGPRPLKKKKQYS